MLAQNIWGQCQAAAVRFVLVCQVLFLGVEWAEETSKWKEKVFFWRDLSMDRTTILDGQQYNCTFVYKYFSVIRFPNSQ